MISWLESALLVKVLLGKALLGKVLIGKALLGKELLKMLCKARLKTETLKGMTMCIRNIGMPVRSHRSH